MDAFDRNEIAILCRDLSPRIFPTLRLEIPPPNLNVWGKKYIYMVGAAVIYKEEEENERKKTKHKNKSLVWKCVSCVLSR
jgi:hypothetical protein